ARIGLEVDDLLVTTERGDRVTARFAATCDQAANIALSGELMGEVPTLLSGPERPLPFALTARWDLALAGTELRAKVLEITACPAPAAEENFSLELLRPIALDLKRLAVPPATAATDWARLRFSGFPLGWLSRWTPGREVAGTVVGESMLRSTPEGMLSFATTTPWTVNDAAVIVGGKTFFSGMARIAPDLSVHDGRYTAAVREIAAVEKNGSRIQGSITAEATLGDRKAKTTIALDAELPALPHAAETFGTVQATLRATSHNEGNRVVVVDEFVLQVRAGNREIFALISPEPFFVGLADDSAVNFGTLSPLKLVTGEIPLAWLQPWLPTMTLDGIAQPTEFLLTAERTKFLVRPVRPVHVRDFAATFAGRPIASEMEFSFYPGLDLTAICVLEPKFQFAFNGAVHLTNGAVNVGGRRAVDIDASFAFTGDDQRVLPSGLEYTSRADFAELSRVPALAGTGLPARGSVVIRANGDMLGKTPLELWMRFEGLPDDKDARILPALELTARGRMLEQRRLGARTTVRLETLPRASDAQFDARIDLGSGEFEVASRLRSEFVDVAEVMAFVDAAQGRRAVKVGKPEDNQLDTYPQLGQPVWAGLRGYFQLDLGLVSYGPYRLERVQGRLELRERELTLTNLSGEMFAGRWSGQARIDYQPEDKKADHTLSGEFKIEQFDSARVVQAVFPTEMASVEAKIDVQSKFRGRGNALPQLIGRAEVDFSAESRHGVVRLSVPKQDFAASAALVGGTLLLSPELRALGRLMQKLAEMPVDQLRITGTRYEGGTVELSEFRLDSPQARLLAQGSIPAVDNEPLMNCPLFLTVDLAAKDDMAVLLGGMSLIEKKPREDGYRALKEKFEMRGKAGEPDTRPLYDLLAKAVLGSKGTWGFLMRKVEEQVKKAKPAESKTPAEQKKSAQAR
ncbi:MAG TPA: AsmA-like C-terminal region-containing protein, partial [Opitutaceae bacterium]